MSEEAFDAIVAAHHGEIYRYLLRATGRTSDADDLSQETFLRAFRAYRSLPPDANTRAWLFATATNLYRNYFRAQKRGGRPTQRWAPKAAMSTTRGPKGKRCSTKPEIGWKP